MGKPYALELDRLTETYAWAQAVPIDRLASVISASAPLPLLAVGSGGSLTAAHLASALHQNYSGALGKPVTPLEFVSSKLHLGSVGVMILSASGANTDVIAALQNAVLREPRRCLVFSLRKGSRLSRLAEAYRFVDLVDCLNPPSVKDGFLATNSLLAFSVLLIRAYALAFSTSDNLPSRLESLFTREPLNDARFHDLHSACRPLWKRETLVVLYGAGVQAAALDLESKFTEAALGNVQISDFRNFAHGRHHWLAKQGSRSSVLALYSEDEREIAERTLRLIPSNIPAVRIGLPGAGPTALLAALVAVLHVVGSAGEQRRIDPGRPGVPIFGRRIYGLRALRPSRRDLTLPESVAIARKLRLDVRALTNRQDLPFWEQRCRQFVVKLQETSFGAIIFDYDGTLCDERDRFSGVGPSVMQYLTSFLRAGIPVGIATGRGRSVRDDLRKGIPQELWAHMHLGYYNGSEIALLADDMHPTASTEPCETLSSAAVAVLEDPIIAQLATCEPRQMQVSILAKLAASADLLWRRVQQIAESHRINVLRSSHSMDLLAPHVSKRSLLAHLANFGQEGLQVLVIGDKGQWPGNDHELLGSPYSLSVDEVSSDPDTCWNFALPGHRGVQAVLDYLDVLHADERGIRIDLRRLMNVRPSDGRGR